MVKGGCLFRPPDAAALHLGFGAVPHLLSLSLSPPAAARKKEEKRFCGDTPRPGRGLAALCTPAEKRSVRAYGATPSALLQSFMDVFFVRATLAQKTHP